jgi:hypothetical protein
LAAGIEPTDRVAGLEASSAWLGTLFAVTLFVSAFLLFLVQPMIAKMVLPILGGAPMVWNACMVFFQVALLAGYLYAHGATRWLTIRAQLALHAVILLLPFLVLPLLIERGSNVPPGDNPIGWLLLLLAGTVGLPFFVLSTSASVLQHWFARTAHASAPDPYFLYAASNLGSFTALAAYSLVVEPRFSVGDQSQLWTVGYALFAAMTAVCAFVTCRARSSRVDRPAVAAPPTALDSFRRSRWVLQAFVPSSLMLAVTAYLSTDIAAVPLLWIVPLAIYLLTFVVAFGSTAAGQDLASRSIPILLVTLAVLMGTGAVVASSLASALHLLTLAAIALYCHRRLAADRPESAHLTEFYLWISVGGLLGGMFNTLVAPVLFDRVLEYPLVLALACFLLPGAPSTSRRDKLLDAVVPAGILLTMAAIMWAAHTDARAEALATAALAVAAFTQRRRPVRFGLSIGALALAGLSFGHGRNQVLLAERTFFGTYRVSQSHDERFRMLSHGTTLHGLEALKGPLIGEPLSYFHRSGPFGQAFARLPHIDDDARVAVIGLGVGTLAAYAGPAQSWTFYEIDPAVERIARDRRYFTYLDRCAGRCQVVIGDARLSLADVRPTYYDLLVLDAFSSDSIPIHLLTAEALDLYLSKLATDGAILFHISNRHLRLSPVVANLAAARHLSAYGQVDTAAQRTDGRNPSEWVVLARNEKALGSLTGDARWTRLAAVPSVPTWTDDFSNIVSVLRLK